MTSLPIRYLVTADDAITVQRGDWAPLEEKTSGGRISGRYMDGWQTGN